MSGRSETPGIAPRLTSDAEAAAAEGKQDITVAATVSSRGLSDQKQHLLHQARLVSQMRHARTAIAAGLLSLGRTTDMAAMLRMVCVEYGVRLPDDTLDRLLAHGFVGGV